jgi:hypothetical protein
MRSGQGGLSLGGNRSYPKADTGSHRWFSASERDVVQKSASRRFSSDFANPYLDKNAHKAAQKSPTKQQAKDGKHRAAASFPCYCQHFRASDAHFARVVFRPVALFREFEFSLGNQAQHPFLMQDALPKL